MTRVIDGPVALRAAVGEELGVSEWHTVTQEQVDAFAAVTGDDYWIHTDVARARETSNEGTIAHGLLTLALGPRFMYAIVEFAGFAMTFNYGFERVRFPAPVRVGTAVRLRAQVVDVVDVKGGTRARILQTFEQPDGTKPVCIAESVLQFLELV
jgi:acyl dehydratase